MRLAAPRWSDGPQRPQFLILLNISSYSAGFLGARPPPAGAAAGVWPCRSPAVGVTIMPALMASAATHVVIPHRVALMVSSSGSTRHADIGRWTRDAHDATLAVA